MSYTTGEAKDKEILEKGRKQKLEDVDVPLRERQLEKLAQKLEEMEEGRRTREIWNEGNNRRIDRLQRQEKLLQDFDEFLEPIYTQAFDWSSTLHLPVTYTVCRTVHGRMMSALLDIDPPFSMKAREASMVDNTQTAEDLLRYTLNDWMNHHEGWGSEVDEWVWHWVTGGMATLKARWEREYTRFLDVVVKPEMEEVTEVDEATGLERVVMRMVPKEAEEEVVRKVFDGPVGEAIPEEDLLIVGGKGNPQKADEVIHRVRLTAGELWSLVDQKVFREEAVKKAIEWGQSYESADVTGGIKFERAENAGITMLDTDIDSPRYEVLERYTKVDANGSGIPTDVILWVHKETDAILRATYLRRVMPSGLRPFSTIYFHQRFGQEGGVGIPELLHTLAMELDAIHNMKVDFGLLSSMPFGYYRPTSNMKEERIPLEPGVLIPVDNPQTDIAFPNLGARWSFTAQEEQFLMGQIERVTSISDLSLGVIGAQGATRTATGTRALVGEANANLNVFLRRLNKGVKTFLNYVFQMLQDRVPAGLQFRITGSDGKDYFRTIKSPEQIAGKWDFELDANSANSNKAVQLEQANEILMLASNPLDFQLGIQNPLTRYEALVNKYKAMGVKDWGRYVVKPNGIQRLYTPLEIANRVLRGEDFQFTPEQDLQGFIDWVDNAIATDEILGQFNEQETINLVVKQREAQTMLQAMEQQAAQMRNSQQVQMNAGISQAGPGAADVGAPVGTMMGGPVAAGQ